MTPTPSRTHPAPGLHRVVACLGAGLTRLEERPVPAPDEGELLLRLAVVGFCGTDLFKLDNDQAQPGAVLGHELVGVVAAAGGGAGPFRIGDRVVVPHHVSCGKCHLCRHGSETMCDVFRENLLEPGAFSEMILVRPRAAKLATRRLPEGLDDKSAVFMEPAACVLRGVRRSAIRDGNTAVILGAGSMGLLHLLVLRAAIRSVEVVVIDPEESRRRIARDLGASRTSPPGSGARDVVLQASSGRGADSVFDTVGGPDTLGASLELARQGGTIVLFAHAPPAARADFPINDLFKLERRVIGTYSGALEDQAAVFELLSSGALDPRPLVTHVIPLDEFESGVDLVRSRQALKVLYTPPDDQGPAT